LHRAAILVVAYAIWFAGFEAVGCYAATLPTTDFTTAWDRAVPLVPAFVWPYELCYALPLLALLVIRDGRRFAAALAAIFVATVTASVVYLLLPVAFPRPPLGASLSDRLLALEYAADFSPGANKLPSMHVALSWIMGCAMYRQRGRVVDVLVFGLVAVITASTVLVKQHLLIDAAAGVAWGLASFWLAKRLPMGRFWSRETREPGADGAPRSSRSPRQRAPRVLRAAR
jgi:membrane-associated phospholipid phosphatase